MVLGIGGALGAGLLVAALLGAGSAGGSEGGVPGCALSLEATCVPSGSLVAGWLLACWLQAADTAAKASRPKSRRYHFFGRLRFGRFILFTPPLEHGRSLDDGWPIVARSGFHCDDQRLVKGDGEV